MRTECNCPLIRIGRVLCFVLLRVALPFTDMLLCELILFLEILCGFECGIDAGAKETSTDNLGIVGAVTDVKCAVMYV